jgi:hypothetical protein
LLAEAAVYHLPMEQKGKSSVDDNSDSEGNPSIEAMGSASQSSRQPPSVGKGRGKREKKRKNSPAPKGSVKLANDSLNTGSGVVCGGGGGSGGGGGGGIALELSPNFECCVSKEFIDEMFELFKKDEKIPKRLRKKELGFEYNELKKMKAMHYASALVETMGKAEYRTPSKRLFATGQSVHHWWAGWFKTATEPRSQIKKANRPNWYSAEVLMALGVRRLKYAGRDFHEDCYQVH